MSKVVIITGANGFLGSHLVKRFADKGWQVRALVRTPNKHISTKLLSYHAYDLTKPLNQDIFKGADYLVHAAYIKHDRHHPNASELNVAAAKRLLAASHAYKLKKNVFISSMSAHEEAISMYGKHKFAIEKLFNKSNDISLRPGLIIGNGGIVRTMISFMKSKHVVPLIGGGKQPVQIIGIDDLVQAIDTSLTAKVSGVLTIAHPRALSYRQLYWTISRELDIKVIFVPVPYHAVLAGLTIASKLPLPLGIGPDNLRGLKKLRASDTSDDLKRLGLKPKSLEKNLQKLAR
jgi:nucleoside-diphosphate-sugar epimerase